MFQEFLNFYLNRAKYELIDEGKIFYGEISELKGVWATGKNLEECRKNLLETLEGWTLLRLRKNLAIPNFKIPYKKLSLNKVHAKT
ncbi:HicB family protein [Candidatus Jorgensenbacteria bacterium CG_4_10_14_0_8_um_filter_39_13]|uniref:HicB family protein n=2 Tax=Candidatus Joergenseniibacteriota TaxID=1752739 RepID=A0A2M7RG68_9BACT|nr:MAG: HicB family protein [Candidatus Jorgensenbacteria bacterium CG11_big_fil_rev_8_21_14_0_20_38_23]PIV13307.1 MAG: HicB family protein [Candidatus Jorgensenbacteria bacterium CG03_land_8_20_14_0_80_38_39]PIW97607.1 MAG: HicB family protein [Candidatus Jorgensenbacteria bacterium CG_4_8_14_3_um_filter_38_10]PIY95740.1 MAG: HicB family protein [Candidatus Jorgensenbacteria bacterium CG_4_10_14_0_8_um_filter_39_13]PJA94858.1 MAG: HicB family protein [Candidatus Jorgensenbacteria bacterium CG_